MSHHSGSLYWPSTAPNYYIYPTLERSIRKQAAVIGSGLSGTLCGYLLAKSGISTVVLEQAEVASGNSSANTGFIQLASDIMLSELVDQIGERNAVRFYAACKHAVEYLDNIAGSLTRDVGFTRRSSLYAASTDRDLTKLEREFRALRTFGFEVEYWSQEDIHSHYSFHKPGAIVTKGDAEINPFLFTHEIACAGIMAGLEIYENTKVIAHGEHSGYHRLSTMGGCRVEAEYVIYATGEAPCHLPLLLGKSAPLSSYTIVTQPQPSLSNWPQRCLIWETAPPSIYMRTTPDGRILAGGLHEYGHVSDKETRRKKIRILQDAITARFPRFSSEVAHEWISLTAASWGVLPQIGEVPNRKNVFYTGAHDHNAIVYSMLAAQIIRDAIHDDVHPVTDIVRINSPILTNV